MDIAMAILMVVLIMLCILTAGGSRSHRGIEDVGVSATGNGRVLGGKG